ncbi:hypothetical protein O163_02105 [Caldanaerobacter subterraneus subsp. yonseiensis KB-1]|uniref:Copper amine oxidase-like N-terminal domain-containing protein n=1 Tax=Caldanaerobacter subterraneus subsp. yonseiensis KB-1 TaxID=1388761 RepID=U5CTJ9_CALSX|nr:stalk domain-containing protein [Caldanaerobacter subterraneus]ERM93099.1 hypothetical protein O163_02105 [Caldanaerobacter subterraneus subsp. yonseiensis KB-1]
MLKRKLLAFVVAFTLVFSAMATGLAFNYVVSPGTTTTTTTNTVFGAPGQQQPSDYTVVFEKNTTKIGDTITLSIKVLDKDGKVVTDKKVLEAIYTGAGGLKITADPRVLVFDTNGNKTIDPQDGSLKEATTSQVVYYDSNPITTIKILPNADVTGFVVAAPSFTSWGLTTATGAVPFYVANYGKVELSGATSITVDSKSYTVSYDALYLAGVTPSVTYLSGNANPLETYPETALITIPGADYGSNNPAKAVLTEDGKTLAVIPLTGTGADVNNDGILDGYKVVLPPMSAGHNYVLTVYARVNYYNWNTNTILSYYATGSVNITPQAAKFELIAPSDKVLAAGIDDPVTFTLNDKLPKGNTKADNANLIVDFAKFVRFTVLKSDNKTVAPVDYVDSAKNIKNGQWYMVTDDGLKAVSLNNNNVVLGTAIAGTYDKDSGKITIKANIPNGYYLKVEGAYTDYVGNGYEVGNPSLKDLGFEKTFVIANLQAKPGTFTMEPSTINANEYRNVKFTVKDVHGNPVPGAKITFNAAIVYLGGTGSTATASNVTNIVETGDDGTVTATLFSAFPTTIMASVSVPVEKSPITLTVNPSQQTGATVVFTIGSDKYTVNGVEKTMDAVPYVKDGRTLVPARYIADAINAQSYYDQDTKVVTFVKGDTIVKFTLGSNKMQVIKNGVVVATQTMETKATTLDASGKDVGRTFILARYLAEAFGYKVDWDAANQTVTIH